MVFILSLFQMMMLLIKQQKMSEIKILGIGIQMRKMKQIALFRHIRL